MEDSILFLSYRDSHIGVRHPHGLIVHARTFMDARRPRSCLARIERRIALRLRSPWLSNITDESEFTGATRSSVKGCARKLPLSSLREETSSPPQPRRRIERRGRSCHSLGSAYYGAIGTSHHEKRSKVALRAAVVTFTILATVWHTS